VSFCRTSSGTPEFAIAELNECWFPEGAGWNRFEEKIFQGPLSRITRDAINFIQRNYIQETIIKHPQRAEAERFWNFPQAAIEEAVVNAIYHRSYEIREPVEIRISSEDLVVLSFPGPDRSIRLEDDQVEDAVKSLTASFPNSNLLQKNQHVFRMLMEGTSVTENRQTGEKSPTVWFVDFSHPGNNRFIAVCQFKVRILGEKHHIIPDILLFINGLPVVVIECKSPKVKEPIPEAFDQLLRYGEQRGVKGEGSAPLFYYNQFVITTCRQEAKFGTNTPHTEKHFYRWADPCPRSLNNLDHGSSSPHDQQRIVAGMFDPELKASFAEALRKIIEEFGVNFLLRIAQFDRFQILVAVRSISQRYPTHRLDRMDPAPV